MATLPLLILGVPATLDEAVHGVENIMWGDGRALRAEEVDEGIYECQEVWD